jgi:hypothetical protein
MRDKRTWIIYEINHDCEFSNVWVGIGAPTRSAPCAAAQAAHPWSRPWLIIHTKVVFPRLLSDIRTAVKVGDWVFPELVLYVFVAEVFIQFKNYVQFEARI